MDGGLSVNSSVVTATRDTAGSSARALYNTKDVIMNVIMPIQKNVITAELLRAYRSGLTLQPVDFLRLSQPQPHPHSLLTFTVKN